MSGAPLLVRSIVALILALPMTQAVAADWPQWRGPNRDDISTDKHLLKEWPESGPNRKWLFDNCGVGYSGPAIVGDRLYILGARDETEQLIVLNAEDGKEIFKADIGPVLENNWGNGPRGTPTVDGELVFAMSGSGTLACIQKADGKVLWTKTMEALGGKSPTWGFTESPLCYKDFVICTPGGEKGAIVALKKESGDVAWQCADLTSAAGYASPILAELNGVSQVIQLLPDQVVGLEAETGKLLWSQPFPGRVAVIPTPIIKDNMIYVTAGYGAGCMLLEIASDNSVKEVYKNKDMKNHHGGVILVGDYNYGFSDDIGWVCQDLKTGENKWKDKSVFGKGSIGYADDMLYCLAEDSGECVLINASPEGWKEHGRFKLDPQTDQRKPAGKIWTHPVIINGRLYLRDQNLLSSFDVTDPSGTANATDQVAR